MRTCRGPACSVHQNCDKKHKKVTMEERARKSRLVLIPSNNKQDNINDFIVLGTSFRVK